MAKVLVVDDEADYRDELELSLSRDKHEIRTAASGREGIDIGARFRPNVLVCDWMLKNTIHGLHVCEVLRAVDPSMQAILITGFPSKDLRSQAERLGVFRFIEKPFELDSMRAAVRHAAAQQSPIAGLPIGVLELDANGRIVYVNPRGQEMLAEARMSQAGCLTDLLSWDTLIWSEKQWVHLSLNQARPVGLLARAKKWLDAEGWLLLLLPEAEQSHINHPIVTMLLERHDPAPRHWPIEGRALLVDGDELVRRVIELQLRQLGCSCHTAETQHAGLVLFERDPEVRVAILDCETESNGIGQFVERLRAIRPDVVIVGYGRHDHRDELAALGVERFIRKPWRVDDLINVLTDRIGNCATCGLAIPLRRPHPGDEPHQWACRGCGATYFAVRDDDSPAEVLEHVRLVDGRLLVYWPASP